MYAIGSAQQKTLALVVQTIPGLGSASGGVPAGTGGYAAPHARGVPAGIWALSGLGALLALAAGLTQVHPGAAVSLATQPPAGPSPTGPLTAAAPPSASPPSRSRSATRMSAVPIRLTIPSLRISALASGQHRTYRVIGREIFDKKNVPLGALFSRTGPERLTLITCGGSFNRSKRSYVDNIVVTAVPS